jgi:putative FmdB family regulatory protein
MPLYEYLCESCSHRFERIQKFSDAPLTECPSCGGRVNKLPSSPAIQFKGSGFYITDYAKPGSKGDSATVSPGKSAPASADSGGGETKTDTKSSTSAPASPAAKTEAK